MNAPINGLLLKTVLVKTSCLMDSSDQLTKITALIQETSVNSV